MKINVDTKATEVWTAQPHEYLSEINFVPRKVCRGSLIIVTIVVVLVVIAISGSIAVIIPNACP